MAKRAQDDRDSSSGSDDEGDADDGRLRASDIAAAAPSSSPNKRPRLAEASSAQSHASNRIGHSGDPHRLDGRSNGAHHPTASTSTARAGSDGSDGVSREVGTRADASDDDDDDDDDMLDAAASPVKPLSKGTKAYMQALEASARAARQQDEDVDGDGDEDGEANSEADRSGAATQQGNGDAEADMEEEEDDDEDDPHVPYITRSKGTVAEAGVVDSIVLRNFMCHEHLTVNLNPQINFIIGHNGSGKSVVLTGLIFAFGAKASTTNRAKSAQDFVRRGASSCEVTVSLRNKGPEAYKPDVYGKRIYITRRVNADGGGGYKIADASKTVKSTKRDEIALICDHFQIQMDNPVNILNQDMAKVFLHSQKPTDKYNFFLRGTQLAQLTEEYQAILLHIYAIKDIVEAKSHRVKELRENAKKAAQQWKEIEQTRNVESQLGNLRNELAWTHVQDAEKEVSDAVELHAAAKAKLQQYDKAIKEVRIQFEEAELKCKEAEAQQERNDNEDLQREEGEVRRKLAEIRERVKAGHTEIRTMVADVKRLQAKLENYEKQIQEARALEAGKNREKAEKIRGAQKALEEINREIDEVQQRQINARSTGEQADADFRRKRGEAEALRGELTAAQDAMSQAEASIANINRVKANSLAAFGQHTVRILEAIERTRWRQKPIGPIGRHVKLKDPFWSKLFESYLGDTLNAFITLTQEDRDQMKRLLQSIPGARHNVYYVEQDGHWKDDMMQRIVADTDNYKCLYNLITIDSDPVLKVLVDQAKIESSVAVKERRIGDALMKNRPIEITGCFTADAYRVGGLDGGYRSTALNVWSQAPRLSRDVQADLAACEAQRAEAEQSYMELQQMKRALETELGNLNAEKRRRDHEATQLSAKLRKLNSKREELTEEAREEEPPNIQAIEHAKAEVIDQIRAVESQLDAAKAQLDDASLPGRGLQERLTEIRNLMAQRDAIAAAQYKLVEDAVRKRTEADNALKQRQAQRAKHNEKAEMLEAKVKDLGGILEEKMQQAEQMCVRERVTLKEGKTAKMYEKQIASLEKALREQERIMGGSAEEIHTKYLQAKKEYEDAKQTVGDLKQVQVIMRDAYNRRIDRWVTFRQHIAQRLKMHFLRNLNNRGFTGELKFKHLENKLEVRVKTNQDIVKSHRTKDVSTLSGGEKSFATICLLLALWQAAGCPIRGLDEYDVFMDNINRRIATRMLISAGQESNATQMILISPQSLTGYTNTPGVKIIKIADPERNQGTLAHGNMG